MPAPACTFRSLEQLGHAARRANTDAGFRYLELCTPVLVLYLISELRKLPALSDPEAVARLETLAQAAAGKRLISDEGMAFEEACDPVLIHNWCQLLGAIL